MIKRDGTEWTGSNYGLPMYFAPNSANPASPKGVANNPYLKGIGSKGMSQASVQVLAPVGVGYSDQ